MSINFLEVNLKNLDYNLKKIKEIIGENKEIIPVIKANGYGIGISNLKDVFKDNNINLVAVATIDEAITIKKHDYNTEVLILNEIIEDEIEDVIKNDLTVGISSLNIVEKINNEANKADKVINIHIKIDTGMGRTGFYLENLDNFLVDVVKFKNINIEGIYTHLSSAELLDDDSIEYTKNQIKKFEESVKILECYNIKPKYIHACASSGIVYYNDNSFNSVRPGKIMYGYQGFSEKISVKPVTKLVSKITFIKDVKKGMAIGYNRKFVAKNDCVIATVGMGYADGLKRNLYNKQDVIINGKRAPIVGMICMDNFMVDISNIKDVKVGDNVYIWDNENIFIEDVCKNADSIFTDVLSSISSRVDRKYI